MASTGVLIASIIAGCSGGTPAACTDIGAYDGVGIQIDSGVVPATGPARVEVCVDGACASGPINPTTSAFVPVAHVRHGLVKVAVILTANSRQVFNGTTTARTIKFQPNGPGCDPTVWQARVRANANGQLTG